MYTRVEGWSTGRQILERDGKVLFEVAELNCCSTCLSRIADVKRVLRAKSLPVEFVSMPSRYDRHCQYVVLNPPRNGEDLRAYVGSVLNLNIS
jgi:hypothetical protein